MIRCGFPVPRVKATTKATARPACLRDAMCPVLGLRLSRRRVHVEQHAEMLKEFLRAPEIAGAAVGQVLELSRPLAVAVDCAAPDAQHVGVIGGPHSQAPCWRSGLAGDAVLLASITSVSLTISTRSYSRLVRPRSVASILAIDRYGSATSWQSIVQERPEWGLWNRGGEFV